MRSIAFFNNKGGVGKTTLLCNLAAYIALRKKKRVLVVDADPQCNATQLMLSEEDVFNIYDNSNAFTVYSIIHPLSIGKGYSRVLTPTRVSDFGVDLIAGDPRLALKEDLLSKDWQDATGGDVRGMRTSYLFTELLNRCENYDFVFFDMGPSLGSINRSVLLSSEYFLSPMSIDIFSLKAVENISAAIIEWDRKLANGLGQVAKSDLSDLPASHGFNIKFAGYVAQQYIQKTTSGGKKKAVDSYERIMKRIPKTIQTYFVEKLRFQNGSGVNYEIGTIPNLYSLIPMSQTARKPIFELRARDGVRGAHFNKVRDAEGLFKTLSEQLIQNLEDLSQ